MKETLPTEAIVIPDIYCPFPSLISPYLAEARKHGLAWVQRFRLIESEVALHYFQLFDMPQIICRCYPWLSRELLFLAVDYWNWSAVYDDQCDEGELGKRPEQLQAVQNHLLAILENPSQVSPQGPVAQALRDCWVRACHLTSAAWQTCFKQHHATYFAAQRQQAEARQGALLDVETYIIMKRDAGLSYLALDFVGLERGDSVFQVDSNPLLQMALRAANHVFGWTNDIYSVRKDVTLGVKDNLVLIVQQTRGGSLQEAVNHVCHMVEQETRRFEELIASFNASCAEGEQEISRYLSDISVFLRGNLEWTRRSPRYQVNASQSVVSFADLDAVLPQNSL